MIKYVFNPEKVLSIKAADKADPQKIGATLAVITEKGGGHLTPLAVVNAARDRKHILHKHFEWEDALAAESFRLDQARSLISCIHVENAEAGSGVARAFMSIRDKDGVSYRSLDDILRSADLQQRVLAQAERDLLAFENRYRDLEDVCELIQQARQRLSIRRSPRESSESRAVT